MAVVLIGGAFPVVVSCSLGYLLLRRIPVQLYRIESLLFGFLSGSACLSLAIFALCLVHQARGGVFLAGGAAAALAAVWKFRGEPDRKTLPPAPKAFSIPFAVAFAAFLAIYLIHAAAPEISPDGSGYHLGNVVRLQTHHGFDWKYYSLYSYFPQGMEMLFLPAFIFGRHSAAAMVHVAFLVSLALLIVCFGRRFGFPGAGYFASLAVFASPLLGKVGTSAYNDVAVAAMVFGVFYLLELSRDDEQTGPVAGLLAGFAFALKYTAALAVPFALLMRRPRSIREALRFSVPAAAMALPWIVRNWIWLGNPLAPFFNRWFPNAYFHTGSEDAYVAGLAHFEIPHWWQIPLDITLFGRYIPGSLGPVFLLAPIALVAIRFPLGRRLLAAAAVFSLPICFNATTRFLIPALPFAALAMGMALAESRVALPALSVCGALLCWPSVMAKYAAPWSWRIREVPVRAARGKEPADRYLLRYLPDYAMKPPIEREVAAGDRIFSFAGRPEAYIGREIVVGYESAAGEQLQDALWAQMDHPPVSRTRFRFPAVIATGARISSKEAANAYWTVAEVRILADGKPVMPASVTASPNRWEAGLAFDGNPATRWSTWQARSPGNYLECQFAGPQMIDEVLVESAAETRGRATVEILRGKQAIPVTGTPEESTVPADGLRAAASRALITQGVLYVWINDGDFIAEDVKKNAMLWSATPVAEVNGSRLYRLGK